MSTFVEPKKKVSKIETLRATGETLKASAPKQATVTVRVEEGMTHCQSRRGYDSLIYIMTHCQSRRGYDSLIYYDSRALLIL
jgi:hypothetical protein